jgi:hypothetical protein
MIYSFLFGGLLFSIINFVVNRLNNSALGALISMVPIGFLTIFIINDKKIITQYMRNIFFVIILNLIIAGIFYLLLKYTSINTYYVSIFIIILWIIVQSANYKYNNFKNEPIIIDETE